MILQLEKQDIRLESEEHIVYHDGREGHPFNLDCSIVTLSRTRAEELKEILTLSYVYTKYRMEEIHILERESKFEVLFSISDFAPLTIYF